MINKNITDILAHYITCYSLGRGPLAHEKAQQKHDLKVD